MSAHTINVTCKCGNVFRARQADINRGWGKSCSKSCAKKPEPIEFKKTGFPSRKAKQIRRRECHGCGYWFDMSGTICSSCANDADRNGDHDQGWDAHK